VAKGRMRGQQCLKWASAPSPWPSPSREREHLKKQAGE